MMPAYGSKVSMEGVLVKEAIAELRACQGDDAATRRYVLKFIQNALEDGYRLDVIIGALAGGGGSILRRVPFVDKDIDRLIEYVKKCTIAELLGGM